MLFVENCFSLDPLYPTHNCRACSVLSFLDECSVRALLRSPSSIHPPCFTTFLPGTETIPLAYLVAVCSSAQPFRAFSGAYFLCTDYEHGQCLPVRSWCPEGRRPRIFDLAAAAATAAISPGLLPVVRCAFEFKSSRTSTALASITTNQRVSLRGSRCRVHQRLANERRQFSETF